MMNHCLRDLPKVYVDDILIYTDTWEEHLCRLQSLLDRLKGANQTANLTKGEFDQAKIIYFGHVIGHGQVAPDEAKSKSIVEYPVLLNKKMLACQH